MVQVRVLAGSHALDRVRDRTLTARHVRSDEPVLRALLREELAELRRGLVVHRQKHILRLSEPVRRDGFVNLRGALRQSDGAKLRDGSLARRDLVRQLGDLTTRALKRRVREGELILQRPDLLHRLFESHREVSSGVAAFAFVAVVSISASIVKLRGTGKIMEFLFVLRDGGVDHRLHLFEQVFVTGGHGNAEPVPHVTQHVRYVHALRSFAVAKLVIHAQPVQRVAALHRSGHGVALQACANVRHEGVGVSVRDGVARRDKPRHVTQERVIRHGARADARTLVRAAHLVLGLQADGRAEVLQLAGLDHGASLVEPFHEAPQPALAAILKLVDPAPSL